MITQREPSFRWLYILPQLSHFDFSAWQPDYFCTHKIIEIHKDLDHTSSERRGRDRMV
jgi:hypothetical protein